MKKVTVYTERGIFASKAVDLSVDECAALRMLIERTAEKCLNFNLETDTGYVVLSRGLLQSAAFVVSDDPA